MLFACGRKQTDISRLPPDKVVQEILTGDLMVPAGKNSEHRISTRTQRRRPSPVLWPYEDVDISSPYGFRIHPVLQAIRMHRGLDLVRAQGTPVLAIADGVVTRTRYDSLYGNVVTLRHEGGWESVYAHLAEITVFPEDALSRGALLGLTGSTGRSTGAHLHLEVHVNGKTVDPLYFLGRLWSDGHLTRGPYPFPEDAPGRTGVLSGNP